MADVVIQTLRMNLDITDRYRRLAPLQPEVRHRGRKVL